MAPPQLREHGIDLSSLPAKFDIFYVDGVEPGDTVQVLAAT